MLVNLTEVVIIDLLIKKTTIGGFMWFVGGSMDIIWISEAIGSGIATLVMNLIWLLEHPIT